MSALKRTAVLLAAAATALVMGAGPAAASSGWVFHSRHHIDDVFEQYGVECAAAGQALVAAGTVQDYRCRTEPTHQNFDLYVITGTWVFHSRHHIDDIYDMFGVECTAAGQAQVAAGNTLTYQCRIVNNATDFDLYILS